MRRDIPPRTAARITVQPVQQAAHRQVQRCETAVDAREEVPVAQCDAYQRSQVVSAPVPGHEGLAGADRSSEGDIAVETRIMDMDRCAQRAVRPDLSVGLARAVLLYYDASCMQFSQA